MSEPSAHLLVDYLDEAAKPTALAEPFDALFKAKLTWDVAPHGLLEKLPLDNKQRDQYDFLATSHFAEMPLYLLGSRPVWLPDIPFIPEYLVVIINDDFHSIKKLGTFDTPPENWTFSWRQPQTFNAKN